VGLSTDFSGFADRELTRMELRLRLRLLYASVRS
jgi:hypothetical protein